jgi:hypothetical protein
MNIGKLIRKLETADPEVPVFFGFCGCFPTTISTYRGDYSQPSLGWLPSGYSTHTEDNPPSVAKLLEELRSSIDGRTFKGWKGGDFSFEESQELHIDNPGDCTGTHIESVVISEHNVTINTEEREL